MTGLVLFILIFLAVGIGFLFVNLLAGKFVRPARPSIEKGEIYECGEEAVGSAWVQFDMRFYVVALLFVVFDVELAFFFPWATVFGTANQMAGSGSEVQKLDTLKLIDPAATVVPDPATAHAVAIFAFAEMAVFFAILLIGFAYLWKRGDLDWVRSTLSQKHSTTEGTEHTEKITEGV